jgi:hypothetical protein
LNAGTQRFQGGRADTLRQTQHLAARVV